MHPGSIPGEASTSRVAPGRIRSLGCVTRGARRAHSSGQTDMTADFSELRVKMVDGQVRTTDVTSLPLLEAMLAVPREAFVPDSRKALAYIDENILISDSSGPDARYMMKPSPFAKLVQLAEHQVQRQRARYWRRHRIFGSRAVAAGEIRRRARKRRLACRPSAIHPVQSRLRQRFGGARRPQVGPQMPAHPMTSFSSAAA